LLQVDFINDRVYRHDESIYLENGYIIDNIKNILSNKLNAVIDRDEEKDIFDIYMICKFYDFDWKEILEIAFVKDNGKIVDDYFQKITTPSQAKNFSYTKLDPMENFYKLDKDKSDIEMTNTFKDVQDSFSFAKKLREDSYR